MRRASRRELGLRLAELPLRLGTSGALGLQRPPAGLAEILRVALRVVWVVPSGPAAAGGC
jgi:hypothetical protein